MHYELKVKVNEIGKVLSDILHVVGVSRCRLTSSPILLIESCLTSMTNKLPLGWNGHALTSE